MQTLPPAPFTPPVLAGFFQLRELLDIPDGSVTPGDDTSPSVRDGTNPALLCVQCFQPVTTEHRRITVAGSHRHVFANPGGHVFEIGCFASAPGCAAIGLPSPDFSWFSGTLWQIAVCSNCALHLGWRYEQGASGGFYGLILDRLRQSPENLA